MEIIRKFRGSFPQRSLGSLSSFHLSESPYACLFCFIYGFSLWERRPRRNGTTLSLRETEVFIYFNSPEVGITVCPSFPGTFWFTSIFLVQVVSDLLSKVSRFGNELYHHPNILLISFHIFFRKHKHNFYFKYHFKYILYRWLLTKLQCYTCTSHTDVFNQTFHCPMVLYLFS